MPTNHFCAHLTSAIALINGFIAVSFLSVILLFIHPIFAVDYSSVRRFLTPPVTLRFFFFPPLPVSFSLPCLFWSFLLQLFFFFLIPLAVFSSLLRVVSPYLILHFFTVRIWCLSCFHTILWSYRVFFVGFMVRSLRVWGFLIVFVFFVEVSLIVILI